MDSDEETMVSGQRNWETKVIEPWPLNIVEESLKEREEPQRRESPQILCTKICAFTSEPCMKTTVSEQLDLKNKSEVA